MTPEMNFVCRRIKRGSRVLDLGCGSGELLGILREKYNIHGYGLEIDPQCIQACIDNGINVIEQDLDSGLGNFPDCSFDSVVMTQTLQAMRYPHLILDEMLRIGRECIITFPNFGYWKIRLYLATNGRMPVTHELAYQWYDTPNIHFFTLTDFEDFCNKKSIKILSRQFFSNRFPDIFMKKMWPSMFAATAVFQLAR